jgi:hypothetical protein
MTTAQTNTNGAAARGPVSPDQVLQFAGTQVQIALKDAAPVAKALQEAVKGWPARDLAVLDPRLPASSVLGDGGAYAARSIYLDETIRGLGVAGAACSVIADLAEDFFVSRPGSLALHCAAFRYQDRLIAMTGPSRAGKSTLASRLTMEEDMALFCDDVLPLLPDDNAAVGLGIAPRLRLPLPPAASADFKAHVARHKGPSDDRYAYLCAPNVAQHGTTAPLAVLLILDRRAKAPARLHQVAEDEALHYLLSQNMADLDTAEAAFDRLSALLRQITCLRLVYADLEQAVALIRHAFGTADVVAGDVAIGPVLAAGGADLPDAGLSPDLIWSRLPDVTLQSSGAGAFLWRPGMQTIWQMNQLARAIWALLEIPGSAADIAEVLADLYPDQDPSSLTADVNALLAALARAGLIEQADSVELAAE